MTSLTPEVVGRLLDESIPSYQATSLDDQNLGFGYLFYGLARVLRPRRTLVIGSKAGFSVLCFALGVRDNGGTGIREVSCYDTVLDASSTGSVVFVDPSYSVLREGVQAWSGIGNWDDAGKVRSLWKSYKVDHIVTHVKATSQAYSVSLTPQDRFDLVYIDGDHSYEGVVHDLMVVHRFLNPSGMVIAHDVARELTRIDPATGGFRALCEVIGELYSAVTVPVFPGLGLLTPIFSPEDERDEQSECVGAPERQ